MALLAGYSNHPDDFAAGLVVFDDFLRRIGIAGSVGVSLRDVTPAAPPAPLPAPGPATAPAPDGVTSSM